MAHFIKLNVLDPSHDGNPKQREYNSNLINLDMVINIEPSKVHSLIFIKNRHEPIRVRESLDEILNLSNSCDKTRLNG
jgi:hypothetical protein